MPTRARKDARLPTRLTPEVVAGLPKLKIDPRTGLVEGAGVEAGAGNTVRQGQDDPQRDNLPQVPTLVSKPGVLTAHGGQLTTAPILPEAVPELPRLSLNPQTGQLGSGKSVPTPTLKESWERWKNDVLVGNLEGVPKPLAKTAKRLSEVLGIPGPVEDVVEATDLIDRYSGPRGREATPKQAGRDAL